LEEAKQMKYVYILRSISHPDRTYVGSTHDIDKRLHDHNCGKTSYTQKYKPWGLIVSIKFIDDIKADKFEVYLKSGSGYAFANRHFI
jgi:putative endonuclease